MWPIFDPAPNGSVLFCQNSVCFWYYNGILKSGWASQLLCSERVWNLLLDDRSFEGCLVWKFLCWEAPSMQCVHCVHYKRRYTSTQSWAELRGACCNASWAALALSLHSMLRATLQESVIVIENHKCCLCFFHTIAWRIFDNSKEFFSLLVFC